MQYRQLYEKVLSNIKSICRSVNQVRLCVCVSVCLSVCGGRCIVDLSAKRDFCKSVGA